MDIRAKSNVVDDLLLLLPQNGDNKVGGDPRNDTRRVINSRAPAVSIFEAAKEYQNNERVRLDQSSIRLTVQRKAHETTTGLQLLKYLLDAS